MHRVVDIFMSKSHKESVMRFFFHFVVEPLYNSPVNFPQVIHERIVFAAAAHCL